MYRVFDKNHFPVRALIIIRPSFRSTPAFDMGMPVSRAISCLACVNPRARFHEKLRPGILVLVLRDMLFVF